MAGGYAPRVEEIVVHPHLQVQADRVAPNHHRFLGRVAATYFQATGLFLFSDYLSHELRDGSRMIGRTGPGEWVAAFAPEGFFEIWGILPGVASVLAAAPENWRDLARGVINAQKFYRSFGRNGYNFGVLAIENWAEVLGLRARAFWDPS